MKLTIDEINKLAALARLKLTDEEAAKYVEELSAILGYVEMLGEVDTAGLKPTAQVKGLVNVMREDEIVPALASTTDLLREAAKTEDNLIVAPRMIG